MVYDYLISIRKPNHRFADQVSQLLYLFSIAVLGFVYYTHPKAAWINLIFIAGIIVAWGVALMKKKNTGTGYFRWGLLIAAAGWLVSPYRNVWMGLLYAVAGILEKQVKFPPEVGFSKEGIIFNSFPKKELQWAMVNNVVIKDGLLTIDQTNNKLYQKEIEGYVTAEIEQEFNQFCRTCIERVAAIAP